MNKFTGVFSVVGSLLAFAITYMWYRCDIAYLFSLWYKNQQLLHPSRGFCQIPPTHVVRNVSLHLGFFPVSQKWSDSWQTKLLSPWLSSPTVNWKTMCQIKNRQIIFFQNDSKIKQFSNTFISLTLISPHLDVQDVFMMSSTDHHSLCRYSATTG